MCVDSEITFLINDNRLLLYLSYFKKSFLN